MLLAESRNRRTGYVVKVYPRFSETFVVREVLAREAQGEDLVIAALRPTTDQRFHDLISRVRAPVTWIPHDLRSARRLWAAVGEAHDLPGLGVTLPELWSEDFEVAGQAVLLARWATEQQVDHLHAHFASLPGRTTRLAARLAGIPYSLTAHAKDLFHQDVDPLRLAAVLRDAAHVVTVSDHNVAWIAEHHPDTRGRVHRIYNGMDLAELDYHDPTDRPTVVCSVGRLVEKKGFADLVDAVALVRDRGVDLRLELAGSGPLLGRLQTQIRQTGLADAVVLHGPMPQREVMQLVRRSAVFAAPCVVAADGDRDGLPTVLLEAMALGTPCVSTPVTGIPEVVRHDETGLLVPERDPFALADAIQRLAQEPALRRRLAQQARTLIQTDFDVLAQARALRALQRGSALKVAS